MCNNQNLESFKQTLRFHADLLDALDAAVHKATEEVDTAFWKYAAAEKDLTIPDEDFQKLEEVYNQAMERRDLLEEERSLEQKLLFHAREALEAWEMLDSGSWPWI